MKKSSILSAFVLFVAALTLSGCIFPYWGDEGGGHRGGYEHEHDHGHHEGGERR